MSKSTPFFGGDDKSYENDDNGRYYVLPSMQSGFSNDRWFNQRGHKLFNIGKPSVMKKVATDFRDLFSQMNIGRNKF